MIKNIDKRSFWIGILGIIVLYSAFDFILGFVYWDQLNYIGMAAGITAAVGFFLWYRSEDDRGEDVNMGSEK